VHILSHPVDFPCGRKPEHPEKTHNAMQYHTMLYHTTLHYTIPLSIKEHLFLFY
jgi:hypothetical protein